MIFMNKQQRINQAMKLVDIKYRAVPNCVRLSKANSFEHELAKFIKAWEALQAGEEVYTEVTFTSGGRADVFIPERFHIDEILCSETEERFNEKLSTYPAELDIRRHSSKEVIARINGSIGISVSKHDSSS